MNYKQPQKCPSCEKGVLRYQWYFKRYFCDRCNYSISEMDLEGLEIINNIHEGGLNE